MANTPDITPPPSSAQWAERLRWTAMALLLAVLAGRLLIGEPPYRTAPLKISEI